MSRHGQVHSLLVHQQPVRCASTAPAQQHGILRYLGDIDINGINSSINIGVDKGISSDEALT